MGSHPRWRTPLAWISSTASSTHSFMGFKMEAFAQPQDRSATIGPRFDYLATAPAAAAICYSFLLRAFHAVVGTQAAAPSPLAIVGATLILALVFVVPFLAFALTCRPDADPGARRLAYVGVTAPTLYVFLGVVQVLIETMQRGGELTPRQRLACDRSPSGTRDTSSGTSLPACRQERRRARRGMAAPSTCSSASAASWSCVGR